MFKNRSGRCTHASFTGLPSARVEISPTVFVVRGWTTGSVLFHPLTARRLLPSASINTTSKLSHRLSIISDGGALTFFPISVPKNDTAESSRSFSHTPIFVVVVTATRNPCAASSFAAVIIEVVLPPLPINDTTSPRQIWSFSVRGRILLRLKLRRWYWRFMRAGMLCIREYARVCPLYRDHRAVQ